MGDKMRPVKQQNEPFDPDDLSRRLTALLVEQKSTADKRREAVKSVAEAEEIDQTKYCQALQEAAIVLDEDRILESRRITQKLPELLIKDKQKLERKLEASKSRQPSHILSTANHSRGKRDRIFSRGDYDWDHDLEYKHAEDFQREINPTTKLGFPSRFKFTKSRSSTRSNNTKDISWGSSDTSKDSEKNRFERHHRQNLLLCRDAPRNKGRTSPLLKRIETNWSLMSKKTPKNQSSVKSVDGAIELSQSLFEPKHSIRTSILARFRRQSNK
ncbi:hypothetical protein K3495_g4861 [Podosphaera aphanis]|nr:hypothetical protein K3495_g4861 [Podosphaera aphanis]